MVLKVLSELKLRVWTSVMLLWNLSLVPYVMADSGLVTLKSSCSEDPLCTVACWKLVMSILSLKLARR